MDKEMAAGEDGTSDLVESKPGVLLIGCPNVGKRVLLSRLLSVDILEIPNSSSGILCQGWTLVTKYYSAELFIWIAQLHEGLSLQRLLASNQLAALVMVFDMSDESSFFALKDWVTGIDIGNFEILLCIGNKADLVPGHYAHAEYRRRLQKCVESGGDSHPEFWDYGITETESYSLLGNEDPSGEIKKSCMEWCIEQKIEYIEACASNVDFDKCLSVDGDVQGVERLFGALSAHMWPGMILKSEKMINYPVLVEKEDFTDDDSEYEIEYEVLCGSADEAWDNTENPDAFSSLLKAGKKEEESSVNTEAYSEVETEREDEYQKHEADIIQQQTSTSEVEGEELTAAVELNQDLLFTNDDLERLMGEIGSMRGNLRLIPDFQRREMAAKLAMKMAAMFGESSDEDGISS